MQTKIYDGGNKEHRIKVSVKRSAALILKPTLQCNNFPDSFQNKH